jgi:hypothetical protein
VDTDASFAKIDATSIAAQRERWQVFNPDSGAPALA